MGYEITFMPAASIALQLQQLDPRDLNYATQFVDQLLAAADQVQASDVHLQPTQAGLEVRWRQIHIGSQEWPH